MTRHGLPCSSAGDPIRDVRERVGADARHAEVGPPTVHRRMPACTDRSAVVTTRRLWRAVGVRSASARKDRCDLRRSCACTECGSDHPGSSDCGSSDRARCVHLRVGGRQDVVSFGTQSCTGPSCSETSRAPVQSPDVMIDPPVVVLAGRLIHSHRCADEVDGARAARAARTMPSPVGIRLDRATHSDRSASRVEPVGWVLGRSAEVGRWRKRK